MKSLADPPVAPTKRRLFAGGASIDDPLYRVLFAGGRTYDNLGAVHWVFATWLTERVPSDKAGPSTEWGEGADLDRSRALTERHPGCGLEADAPKNGVA